MKQRKPHRNERTQGKQLWKKLGIIKIQIIDNNEEWLTDVFKAHLIFDDNLWIRSTGLLSLHSILTEGNQV